MISRKRSPTCPVVDLQEALALVDKLYRSDKTHPVDRVVAATNMGYSGLTGRSMSILATLRQYGLLDTLGESQVRVSDLAVRLIYPEDEAERRVSLKEAALFPRLFLEVFEKFGGVLPSDANLMSFLVRQGFLDTTASTAIKVIKSSYEFAGVGEEDAPSSNIIEPVSDARGGLASLDSPVTFQPDTTPKSLAHAGRLLNAYSDAREGVRQEVFTVDEGEVVVSWPQGLSIESYQDVADWIEIVLRKMKRAATG